MALTIQDQYIVAKYFQARLKVHSEKILEHCTNIDAHIKAVRSDDVQKEIRKIAARQAVLREALYGAKYLLSPEVFKSKIEFDEKFLDPNFYSNRKKEEKHAQSDQ